MSDKKNNWAIRTASNLLEGISESEVKRRFPNEKSVDSFTNFLIDKQLDGLDFLGKTSAEKRKNLATNLKVQLGLVEEPTTSTTSTSNNPTDELIDEIFYVDDSQSSSGTNEENGVDLEDFLKMVEDGDVDNDFTDERNRDKAGGSSDGEDEDGNGEGEEEGEGEGEGEGKGEGEGEGQGEGEDGDGDENGEEGGSEEEEDESGGEEGEGEMPPLDKFLEDNPEIEETLDNIALLPPFIDIKKLKQISKKFVGKTPKPKAMEKVKAKTKLNDDVFQFTIQDKETNLGASFEQYFNTAGGDSKEVVGLFVIYNLDTPQTYIENVVWRIKEPFAFYELSNILNTKWEEFSNIWNKMQLDIAKKIIKDKIK